MAKFLIILLVIIATATNSLKSQVTLQNLPPEISRQLNGAWYNQAGGAFQVGLYDRGAVYKNQFWHYATITEDRTSTVIHLKNDQGDSATLIALLKKQQLSVKIDHQKAVKCLKSQDLCEIKHNLAAIQDPKFKIDSIHLHYFILSADNQQISVTEHELITGLTKIHFQAVDQSGMLHMVFPVNQPVLLEVQLPFRKQPEHIFMLPGSDILILHTHGEPQLAGSGALLATEFNQLASNRQDYHPDPFTYLSVCATNHKAPTPEGYKLLLDSLKIRQTNHLNTLFKARQISPLTYQIYQYQLRYAIANALLHYHQFTKRIWGSRPDYPPADPTATNNQLTALPANYFDFLRGLDNDSAIIAPSFWDFIQAFRDPNSKADMPAISHPPLYGPQSVPVSKLSELLLPIKHLDPPLTNEQTELLKNYPTIQNPDDQATYQNIHQTAIKEISNQYYPLYIYNVLSNYVTDYFIKNLAWQPGVATDLFSVGNITSQYINQQAVILPEDYFMGPNKLFKNDFIAVTYLVAIKNLNAGNTNTGTAIANHPQNQDYNQTAQNWTTVRKQDFVSCDTIRKNGYTLIFANNYPSFDPAIKDSMISTFFTVYPLEVTHYNPAASKTVIMVIDSNITQLAATVKNVIRIQPKWFEQNPKDYDIVTHEAMHVVQDYTLNNFQPRWLAEGIADYIRQLYGLHNKEANWSMTPLAQGMHYTNSYRITARFLYWITEHKDPDFVKVVDKALRANTYNEDIWLNRTGMDLDTLWQAYIKNPEILMDKIHQF